MDKINLLSNLLLNGFGSISGDLDTATQNKKQFSKWSCYSDYCFGDPNKINNAISFVLVPFESEIVYNEYLNFIKTKQSKDLKEVKTVNPDFLSFLKEKEIITFAYLLDDYNKWLGEDINTQRNGIKGCLQVFKTQLDNWSNNAVSEDIKNYYSMISKQIDGICSRTLKKTEVNTFTKMLLVAVVGAVTIYEVAKRLDSIDILGWFSDRDDILDLEQGLIVNIMYFTLYCLLQKDFQFATYNLDSTHKPFFDDFNRISDIITGTFADFDVRNNIVSKNKFGKVLREYCADNEFTFIHRLSFDGNMKISEIKISSVPPTDTENNDSCEG